MESGQLAYETLDEVAPRLRMFIHELTRKLGLCGVKVGTMTGYLLNSTEHPMAMPCLLNDVPVQMRFDAALPRWADDPRARLQIRFATGKPYYYTEIGDNPKRFPIKKVTFRILRELERETQALSVAQKLDLATEAFEHLTKTLGARPTRDSTVVRVHGAKIKKLDAEPGHVLVVVKLTHERAVEMLKTLKGG
jgi:hypothetical protein